MINMKNINKANQHYVNIKKDTLSNNFADFEKLLSIHFPGGASYKSPDDISDTQIKSLINIIHDDDIDFFIDKIISEQANPFISYEYVIIDNKKRILSMLIKQRNFESLLNLVSHDNQLSFINQTLHILPELYKQYKSDLLHLFLHRREKITDIKYKPFRDEIIENLIANNAPVIKIIMGQIEKEDDFNKSETHIILDVIEKIESCGLPFFITIKNMKEESWIKNLFKIHDMGMRTKSIALDDDSEKSYSKKILEKIKEAEIPLTSIFYGNYLQLLLRQLPVAVFDEIVKYSVQHEMNFLYSIDKEINENPLPLGYNLSAQENYNKLYAIIERKKLNETLKKSKLSSLLSDVKRI